MAINVYTHQLSLTDSTNKFFSLDGVPTSPTNVALDIVSGTAQAINGDFRVDGTIIAWDSSSYGLNGQLSTRDIVRVIYDRS